MVLSIALLAVSSANQIAFGCSNLRKASKTCYGHQIANRPWYDFQVSVKDNTQFKSIKAKCFKDNNAITIECNNGQVETSREGQDGTCPRPTWQKGEWTYVFDNPGVGCGPRTGTRSVSCPVNGACDGDKPVSTRPDSTPCTWQTGEWTYVFDNPGAGCGPRTGTRSVSCPVDGACDGDKPDSTETKMIPCLTWQIGAWTSWDFDNAGVFCGPRTRTRQRSCPVPNKCDTRINAETDHDQTLCTWQIGAWTSSFDHAGAFCGPRTWTRTRNCPVTGACGTSTEADTKKDETLCVIKITNIQCKGINPNGHSEDSDNHEEIFVQIEDPSGEVQIHTKYRYLLNTTSNDWYSKQTLDFSPSETGHIRWQPKFVAKYGDNLYIKTWEKDPNHSDYINTAVLPIKDFREDGAHWKGHASYTYLAWNSNAWKEYTTECTVLANQPESTEGIMRKYTVNEAQCYTNVDEDRRLNFSDPYLRAWSQFQGTGTSDVKRTPYRQGEKQPWWGPQDLKSLSWVVPSKGSSMMFELYDEDDNTHDFLERANEAINLDVLPLGKEQWTGYRAMTRGGRCGMKINVENIQMRRYTLKQAQCYSNFNKDRRLSFSDPFLRFWVERNNQLFSHRTILQNPRFRRNNNRTPWWPEQDLKVFTWDLPPQTVLKFELWDQDAGQNQFMEAGNIGSLDAISTGRHWLNNQYMTRGGRCSFYLDVKEI